MEESNSNIQDILDKCEIYCVWGPQSIFLHDLLHRLHVCLEQALLDGLFLCPSNGHVANSFFFPEIPIERETREMPGQERTCY